MHSPDKNTIRQKGFTLIETLVVVAITGIVMIAVTTVFKDILVDSRQESAALNVVDQSRIVAANFVNEVRNITYGADGSFPLNQAGSSQIVFFTTYHTGGVVDRVRYFISGTSLEKGVTVPSGTPAAYTGTETVSPVITNVTNGLATAAFYYYDGNYAGPGSESPLAQPVNVNSVKFLQFNLTILKQDATGSTSTFSVDDGATLRSLKTNLGN